MKATEVFTPGEFPEHTYVERTQQQLESKLRDALATPGEVVSISGPSKSGKTVLVERVVGNDELITVSGARLSLPDELWDRVLDWMEVPVQVTRASSQSVAAGFSGKGSGHLGLPGVAKGSLEAGGQASAERGASSTETHSRTGLDQVVREIADSDYVLLIDDYHYMDRSVQTDVAKQIKDAARQGVKIVAASVPHRADDVVRGNPELRGRVRAIDIEYWTAEDLQRISDKGFPLLNMSLDRETITKFATEVSGSPQLMQAVCLQTCFELGTRDQTPEQADFVLDRNQHSRILEETATRTDYSSLLRSMHTGPKKRGTERKVFAFYEGTRGDVYRCVLLATAADPPRLGFSYNELYERVQRVCKDDLPQAASIYQSCAQISSIAEALYPDQRVIEWDDNESRLDIIDPYFLFFVRWSDRLRALSS